MKPRALTAEQAARLREEYWRGKVNSVKRIAERYGINASTVRMYVRRAA